MGEEKLLQAISQLQSDGNLKKLYNYAYYLNSLHELPWEMEPKDVVHEAIKRLLTGERAWDAEKSPDVIVVLKGIIKSLYSHAWELEYNRTRLRSDNNDGENIDIDSFPVGDMDDTANSVIYSELRSEIETAIGDDEELMQIYFALLEGYETPRDIAQYLNINVKEVYVLIRRLRRKCRNHIKDRE